MAEQKPKGQASGLPTRARLPIYMSAPIEWRHGTPLWVALCTAAAMIDVSKDTILRRSVPWREEPILHRIRYRLLGLDQGTRRERRYLASDVGALMSDDEEQTAQSTLPTVYIEKEPDGLQLVEPTPRGSNSQEPASQKAFESRGAKAVSNQATSQAGRPTHVEAGIYQNPQSRTYFERPHINGKRTWRSLKTKNLKLAWEELHRRRSPQ